MQTKRGASPVMIGRDRELQRLSRLVATRRPQVAICAGEPGIGKTRLMQELLATLPTETVTLVGHAEPDSLARPYELLLDLIDGTDGPAVDKSALVALTDAERSPVERLRIGVELVTRLVSERPAVIVFEDLHWADSESTALFERLADQQGPRLLIGTYRPDGVSSRHPLAALLDRLDRRHEVTHLRLGRLSPADTASLLAAATGQPVPFRAAAGLYHRTGGNPFWLEELLRAYDGQDLAELCSQPLPWSLAEILRRQVDDLRPDHRRIVEAAAVLGNRVPFDLLAAVTGVTEEELIEALRELVARGVLVESGEDVLSFRHALVREALTGQMLGRQRRRLHETALEVMLAAGEADPALVAHHARAAGRYDEMVAAARRGSTLYLSIGSVYQALQLAEMGLAEEGDDLELLAGAARAAWLAGLLDDAARYARRQRELADSVTDQADALYLLVRLAWETDRITEMETLTREVEQLVDKLPPGAPQAQAMTAVAQSHMLRGQIDAAVAWADQALASSEQFDLPQVRLAALVEQGTALSGQLSTAEQGHAILAGLVDEAEDRGEWVLAARALANLVAMPAPSASHTDQAELLERMRVNAERAGFESLAVAAYFAGRARLAIREGDLPAAIEALEAGRARERGYQLRDGRVDYHGVFLAGLCLESGDLVRVEELMAELQALPRHCPLTLPGLAFQLACRQGRLDQAEQLLDDVLAIQAWQTWQGGDQTHDLVSAALHVGLPLPRVRRLAAETLSPQVWDDWRKLTDSQLAEAAGATETALTGYVAVADSQVLPPAVRGTARTGAARCLHVLGRPAPAAAQATAAGELLRRWGGWRVAALAQVRAQLGMAPPDGDRPITGVAALTPREREVAVLVAAGLTNVELARRLYISPRTAAVHVSHILRKLALTSRTEIGAALDRPVG